MSPKDKKLILGGLAICIIIAILAPFIASADPDGLGRTAEQISSAVEGGVYDSPFPDYTTPVLGEDNPIGGILALIIGVLVTLIIAYVVALVLRRRNPPETSK